MKPERIIFIALLFLVMMNAGCAGPGGGVSRSPAFSAQEHLMTEALAQLRLGNEPPARDLLEKIIDGTPAIGVTDEALFRLALLSMKETGGKGLKQAQALLERLVDKYPDSLWTRQSVPLLSLMAEVRVLRNRARELKTLRGQNLSLSHDNRELRQSLERLKQLDLELEQKIKH